MKNNPRRLARQTKRANAERYAERRQSSPAAQSRSQKSVSLPSVNALRGIKSGDIYVSLDPEVYGQDD
jgi:hypothetical protein